MPEYKIEYRKGNLFDAPHDAILAHACNCMGVWGAGVAKQFADLFPRAYEEYRERCKFGQCLGTTELVLDKPTKTRIACLFTSHGYGLRNDSVSTILANTEKALVDLFSQVNNVDIHSPMINSGLFNVPWPMTEELIESLLPDTCSWTVWELPS